MPFGADYTFSKSLKPLEKPRADITPISGLYQPHGLGHHHNCSKIWLTGGKLGQAERNTISVDQLMAQATAPHTRMVFFGEKSLRRAVAAYLRHYHAERNHQGVGNKLIECGEELGSVAGKIACRQRLGGLLRYYYRDAA